MRPFLAPNPPTNRSHDSINSATHKLSSLDSKSLAKRKRVSLLDSFELATNVDITGPDGDKAMKNSSQETKISDGAYPYSFKIGLEFNDSRNVLDHHSHLRSSHNKSGSSLSENIYDFKRDSRSREYKSKQASTPPCTPKSVLPKGPSLKVKHANLFPETGGGSSISFNSQNHLSPVHISDMAFSYEGNNETSISFKATSAHSPTRNDSPIQPISPASESKKGDSHWKILPNGSPIDGYHNEYYTGPIVNREDCVSVEVSEDNMTGRLGSPSWRNDAVSVKTHNQVKRPSEDYNTNPKLKAELDKISRIIDEQYGFGH
ncbi:hypothetical protein AYI68_g8235 [Smittium mucronatum]|uniref:Uncharacterized protein n=1 Tax=Smittium mucronatum TaxID=133383 RepID=A0A1R0GLH9_9FUNG|nr:hypothetical protein AYI68_g8235 [Smittium mucronatum]